MTASGQVFTATPPTPPTALPALPVAPVIAVEIPGPTRAFIDGTRIPVVPPFIYAAFTASAANTPTVKPSTRLTAATSGSGLLTTVASASTQSTAPMLVNEGTTTARVRVGSGGVVVAASFGSDSRVVAGDASFAGVAAMSAAVVPALSASAAFGTTGVSASTRFGPIPMAGSGTGTLSASVPPPFRPSGMTKNGDQQLTGNWLNITGWIAETASLPGSVVTSDGLVAQGTTLKALVSATVPYVIANGFGAPRQAVRILVNGAVVATGQEATGWSGTMTATATVRVDSGDRVTVQGWSTHGAAVRGGTSTRVRIERAPA
ncbi:hypothetical protein [Nocardia sp. NPDC052566]|uniref:hypothetical protein n=1 Tax=Nocardia sp. NPDC052566 TaxID=3364330 RepID=UPI0037C8F9BF